ncbi:MAG: hypothetical protein A3B78_02085 [Omnitrophica WOR_2 bacterium RIFCSPHIGHO2_02_FULL_67_20]|nr:MAG: hypothetical protein A3B78_02085 [Omnitrophica WOR_2 bacterium RIFCSPHIGHO2_02_FULL_67_20]
MNGLALRGLLILVPLAAAAVWGLSAMGVDVAHLSPERLRAAVLSYGVWAPLAYFAIFGQPFVPLPGSVMLALAGVVFGKGWGALAGLAGATLRASATFLLARLLGRDAVARLLPRGRITRLNERIGQHAFNAVLLIRLIPNVPFDMQNYGLSFSRVRFGPYVLATALGLAPASIAYAYLGDSLTDLAQFWKLLGAVCLVAALVIAQRAWRRRKRRPELER